MRRFYRFLVFIGIYATLPTLATDITRELGSLQESLNVLAGQMQVGKKLPEPAEDIHVEIYNYNPKELKDIEHIITSHISIEGKKWPYTELLGTTQKDVLHLYGFELGSSEEEMQELHKKGAKDPIFTKDQKRFVAKTASGRVVGFGHVEPHDPDEDEEDIEKYYDPELKNWLVRWLAVDPEYVRHRVGLKLFDYIAQWVKDWAKKQGKTAEFLHIECDNFNKRACEAYRKWTNNECHASDEESTVCKRDLRIT